MRKEDKTEVRGENKREGRQKNRNSEKHRP